MSAAAAPSPPAPPSAAISRRIYRGLAFAVMVGVAGAAVSFVPGLFLQSVFVGETQRCIEAQQKDIAVGGEIVTDCGEALADAPVWLPLVMVAAGGAVGVVGGFGYGFFQPSLRGRAAEREKAWLPF